MNKIDLKLIKGYIDKKVILPDLSNKAEINSPQFMGVPIAPTATEGTNTTQIATTAFVQNAVGIKLTREQIIEIIEDLYPEATSAEIEEMADEVLENYSTAVSDLIQAILSDDQESGGEGGGSYGPIDLDSITLTGTPTAPTAPYGTNTTQIATTAFVQQATKPSLIVTVSDIPSNITATVTVTLNDNQIIYSETATLNSSGIAVLNLEYLGEYLISFSSSFIEGNSSINITLPRLYNYSAFWSDNVTYTVNINTANSNTETACVYDDDAEGMTKGSSDWDLRPIFRNIKPCIFQNGEVNYYLNPNNWNQKIDGTASDLTGADGDVMIEFPKFAYKIKTVDSTLTVSVSTDPTVIDNDSDYTYEAFTREEDGDLSFFYKGAFKGYVDGSGKLRSLPGFKPTGSKTISQCRTAARENGSHYQQSTYAQLKALQCLYLIKYGNRNGQAALGNGNVNNTETLITGYNTTSTNSASSNNSTLALGMDFGSIENETTHMRLFGIEDFWGNINEWVEGVEYTSDRCITISNAYSNENVTPFSYTYPQSFSTNVNGFITQVIGDNTGGFIASLFGGSSTTSWTDKIYLHASAVCRFGGTWSDGSGYAGPFIVDFKKNSSTADQYNSARLSYI